MAQSTVWSEFCHGYNHPNGGSSTPRAGLLYAWQNRAVRTGANHIGRAAGRTADHAIKNWPGAIGWTAVLTGAALMHPYLTAGSTLIYTGLMSHHTWTKREDGWAGLGKYFYDRGNYWRKWAGDDLKTLAIVAASMLSVGFLSQQSPNFREFAFVGTWLVAPIATSAISTYFAQEL